MDILIKYLTRNGSTWLKIIPKGKGKMNSKEEISNKRIYAYINLRMISPTGKQGNETKEQCFI